MGGDLCYGRRGFGGIDELVGEGLVFRCAASGGFDDGEDREQSRSRCDTTVGGRNGGTVFATGFTTSFATGFTARGKRGGVAEISVDLQRTGGDEHYAFGWGLHGGGEEDGGSTDGGGVSRCRYAHLCAGGTPEGGRADCGAAWIGSEREGDSDAGARGC